MIRTTSLLSALLLMGACSQISPITVSTPSGTATVGVAPAGQLAPLLNFYAGDISAANNLAVTNKPQPDIVGGACFTSLIALNNYLGGPAGSATPGLIAGIEAISLATGTGLPTPLLSAWSNCTGWAAKIKGQGVTLGLQLVGLLNALQATALVP